MMKIILILVGLLGVVMATPLTTKPLNIDRVGTGAIHFTNITEAEAFMGTGNHTLAKRQTAYFCFYYFTEWSCGNPLGAYCLPYEYGNTEYDNILGFDAVSITQPIGECSLYVCPAGTSCSSASYGPACNYEECYVYGPVMDKVTLSCWGACY
jgi:hypothetical protein